MLYDNALLARAYLHGWQALGHERYRRVCEETLDWALREMRGPEGGFYSALDADSEGEEGRFYVWTRTRSARSSPATTTDEPHQLLIQQVDKLMRFYGVSERGNFEGRNILHLAGGAGAAEPEGLDEMRRALYEARAKRVWPGLDDKRLTAWNALMISALAEAGAVLEREDYLDAARGCADVRLGGDARCRGQPAAHLQGRPRPPQRLPRGPCLPARGAAHPLRSDLRAALVRARPASSPTR